MIFGKNKDKGIVLRGTNLEVVTIGENGITENDILVHDETTENTGIHMMLAQMRPPQFPMAFGVIRAYKQPTYNQLFEKQMNEAQENAKIKCVDDLLNSGETWEVE
jgi:2-oxoglutarate ferredoxin oxidoreductase subunit beta